ncbi:MAG: hypothetical protein ACREHG_10225 [Candidatus Saccharimonadales bacterium]
MNKVFDLLTGVVIVAAIFVLVRPRSQGPAFVKASANGFSTLIKSATGGGKF